MAARVWVAVAVVMAGVALAQTAASDISTDIRMVLVRDLRFSTAELADLQRGKVVRGLSGGVAAGRGVEDASA